VSVLEDKITCNGLHGSAQNAPAYASASEISIRQKAREQHPCGPATHRTPTNHGASDSAPAAKINRQDMPRRRTGPPDQRNDNTDSERGQKLGWPDRYRNSQRGTSPPPPPPGRRLVCHYRYQNQSKCDEKIPCSSRDRDNRGKNDCTRTLCFDFSNDGICTSADTRFMARDEQVFLFPRTAPTYQPGRTGKLISV
jgi:hypothetical protein